jgi:hypothetical protein
VRWKIIKERRAKMRKMILILAAIIITAGCYAGSAVADVAPFSKVIEVPGANKELLMTKVRSWAKKYASSYVVDTKSGLILASGEMTYSSPPIDRIQYTISYEMRNSIEGNRDTVTFEKVMLKSPEMYFSSDTGGPSTFTPPKLEPLQSKKDIAAAQKVMNHVTGNLEAFLLNKSDAVCPLMKCQECVVLCPSSEELKEHMKSHEHMKGHPGHETSPKQ